MAKIKYQWTMLAWPHRWWERDADMCIYGTSNEHEREWRYIQKIPYETARRVFRWKRRQQIKELEYIIRTLGEWDTYYG